VTTRVLDMNWRSRKLLDHIHECPECFACGAINTVGNIVPAHSNQLRDDKGKGIKAHDYRVAAMCNSCHHELDQGMRWTKEERVAIWELAHRKTIGWLFSTGRVTVT
jgi:hypothetical protein